MTVPEVLVATEGPVRRITMNRPDRLNAMTFGMWDGLIEAFTDANGDPDVRVIVLAGAGAGFCAGRDMDEAASYLDDQPLTTARLRTMHHGLIPAIAQSPKPVVAAVNGAAVGAGLSLALACDLRVASARARFAVGFVAVGLNPDAGAIHLLPRAVGYPRAFDLAIHGETVDAARALAIGLIDRVFTVESFDEEVGRFAERIASMPPQAAQATKRLLLDGWHASLEDALDAEAEVQPRLLATAAYRERIAEFLARREGRAATSSEGRAHRE